MSEKIYKIEIENKLTTLFVAPRVGDEDGNDEDGGEEGAGEGE